MLARLGVLSATLVAAACALVLSAQPASADGGTVVGMPSAVATSNGGTVVTCDAYAHANWYVYPEGDAGVTFGARTSCDTRPMAMQGTVELIPNGGSTAVASGSCFKLNDFTCTVPDRAFGTTPGSVFALRYTTSLTAPIGFSWTMVPPHCTVSGQRINCTMITFFTVN